MLEKLHSFIALIMAMPTDRVLIFVILAALGLVGYVLHVHLIVIKSLSIKGKE